MRTCPLCSKNTVLKEEMYMKLDIIKNPAFKKGLGIISVAFAGIAAVSSALSDQKREQEFEELKKTVSELSKNK